MKKTLATSLLAILMCVCLVFGFTACGNKCAHTYDDACDTTCNKCNETRKVGEHVYDDACDEICNECDEARAITHDYTDYDYDDYFHSVQCSVCEAVDEASQEKHTFGKGFACECGVEFTEEREHTSVGCIVVKFYNAESNLVYQLTYSKNKMIEIREYCYDENGNKTKETVDFYGSVYVIEYEYDVNGNMIKRTHTESDGSEFVTEYEYDANGRLIKKTWSDSEGNTRVSECVYDENGNKIKETYLETINDPLPSYYGYEITYVYDENGKLIKETCTNPDGVEEIYEYN